MYSIKTKMILDKIGFQNWMSLKKLSPRSITEYLYYLDKLNLYAEFNQDSLNEFLTKYNNSISRAFIKNYMLYLKENKKNVPYSPQMIESILDLNIPKITGRGKKKIPLVISLNQLLIIENYMTTERNKLMLLITFYGGLRIGGLLNIKPYDFAWKNWSNDTLKPCQLKVTEKGNKERIVMIPPEIAERTKKWIINVASKKDNNKDHPIFKVKKRYWGTLLDEASLKGLGFKIHPHTLRHSCATHLLGMNWTLQEIADYLGHDSISTTQIYAHLNKEKIKEKYSETFGFAQ